MRHEVVVVKSAEHSLLRTISVPKRARLKANTILP